MSAIDAATPVEAINNNSSAGQRLRCAREQLSLSIRDVASALNLMVSHVRGIETDRYAALTNDKQFLHHLHDYATLVELDAKEIVDIYRSQSAATAAQIEARPAKNPKRYVSKWYGVGALAVTCVCLGVWSLNQTLPFESTGNATKLSDEPVERGPSTASMPAGENRIATNTSKPAANPQISVGNAVSASPATASREEPMVSDEVNAPGVDKAMARSDQAALETSQERPSKSPTNSTSAPTNTILSSKNALRAIGAKPLRKTLIELKNEGITQAKR